MYLRKMKKLMKLNIQKFANSGTLGTLSGQWKTTFTVTWSLLSQSIETNTSTIRLTGTLHTDNSTTIQSSSSKFVIDGTTVYNASYKKTGAGDIFTKTKDITVTHNNDGTFPNRAVSFSAWDYGAFSASPSGSGTISGVPTIPRTSVLSNLVTTISNDGSTITLRPTITKYASAFYDRLTLVNGSTIIAQIDGVSNNTSVSLNSSQISALYREMGNSTSKSFSAYLTTYTSNDKSSTVGTSTSINTTVTLPNYNLSIGNATIEDTDTNYDEYKETPNTFIANISKPKMTFNATSTTGSTYGNSISYRINDVVVSSPYTVDDYKGDKYTLVATDGRKQVSKEFDMKVVPYFKPTIQATVKRTSPTGSTVDVSIEGKYYLGSDLTNKLTPTYKIKYTPRGGSQLIENISVTTTTEGNEVTFKGTTQLTGLDYKKIVSWQIEMTDVIGYLTMVSDTLKQGLPVWNAYEKNDEQYFNVNGNFLIENEPLISFLKPLLLDLEHPVGSLYISTDSTEPSKLFGGTWKQIEDDAYLKIVISKAGQCGGTSNNHTIPLSSIPKHSHKQNYMSTDFGQEGSSGNYTFARATGQDPAYTGSAGGGQPYYPYYYGIYAWIRIA